MEMNDEELLLYVSETLEQAKKHIEAEQWQEASVLLVPAIEKLGKKYRLRWVIDDTTTNVRGAVGEEKRGALQFAANLRFSALQCRYERFLEKVSGRHMAKNADEAIEKADQLIAKDEYKEANACLLESLKEIGDRYFIHNPEDDGNSEKNLVLAAQKESNNKLNEAASLRAEALKYRRDRLVTMYAEEKSATA